MCGRLHPGAGRYLPASAVSPFPGGLLTSAGLGAVPSASLFCVLTDGGRRSQSHYFCSCPVSDTQSEFIHCLQALQVFEDACLIPAKDLSFPPLQILVTPGSSPWPQVSLVSCSGLCGWFLTVQMLLRHYTLPVRNFFSEFCLSAPAFLIFEFESGFCSLLYD